MGALRIATGLQQIQNLSGTAILDLIGVESDAWEDMGFMLIVWRGRSSCRLTAKDGFEWKKDGETDVWYCTVVLHVEKDCKGGERNSRNEILNPSVNCA